MRTYRLWLPGLLVGLASVCAMADESAEPAKLDLSKIIASMGGEMPMPMMQKEGALPEFDKVTEGMESKKGLFTLWYYPPGTKDKDSEKLLCQIPASFLGEKFMLSTSFSGGGFFTGFPLDERVVQWELLDNQLLLVEPDTRFVVDKSKEVSDVVSRTYPDRIRVAIPLVTKSPGGDPVIDLGQLLKSDFADIGWMSQMGGFFGIGMGAGSINPGLSKWTKKKTFDRNVEIGVELAVSRMSPPGSFDKKIVHFSFWSLPKSSYNPRAADDRIGYFLTTNQDWAKPTDARDTFNRYVDRWPLEKRDPALALCEPKQPITFYIEKTVPVKFRRAVRDGILEWNKAFEKVGFVNAVEVRQQTDDNEWKDIDPEDMNYSFFRWIVTGAGFAMGPHRANPFTGEIYDADIIFDDSMVRYFEQEAQMMLPSGLAALKAGDPALETFLGRHPEWNRPARPWEHIEIGERGAEEEALRQAMRQRLGARGFQCCDYAAGMKQQVAFGKAMMVGQPPEVIDRFLYDVIKEVVMHEVGHTLGLRHNFKASSVWNIEELKQRKAAGDATTGSVMDYNPVLFFADNATEGNFVTPTIGPYDFWAIEYGYRPFDASFKSEGDKDKDKDSEAKEGAGEETAQADDKTPAVPPGGAAKTVTSVDLSNIPPEVLAQIPPEIKEMLASGKMEAMMQSMGQAAPGVPGKAPSGPEFKAPPSGEEAMLRKIAARSAEPELVYATDEDCTMLAPDPTVNRFDMAKDAIGWAKTRAELADQRMASLLDWAVKDDESWYHLQAAYLTLLFEKARVVDFVGRYIGGQYFNRHHRGAEQAPAPFELVDTQTQRDALSFIEDTLFTDKFFEVDAKVLNHLAPSRWWHEGSSVSFTMDFPVHDVIAIMQWWNLFDRLFPNTLRRIHDAEMKTNGSDKFTVAEYLQRVQKACWGETASARRLNSGTWTDNNPFVSSVRRSLQREYLGLLEPVIRKQPGEVISPDLHAMVQYSLQLLAKDLDEVIKAGKADFASQAHLVSCKSRIDRMLAPELDEQQSYPTGMFMFGATAGQRN